MGGLFHSDHPRCELSFQVLELYRGCENTLTALCVDHSRTAFLTTSTEAAFPTTVQPLYLLSMMKHNTQKSASTVKYGSAWRSTLFMAALAVVSGLSAQNCAPVDVPYMEDFNAVTVPALPECIALDAIVGTPWQTVIAPTGMTGNAANVSYTPAGSPDQDNWLFTRGLNLSVGTSYRLTYEYFNNSTFFQENLSVSFGTDTTAAAMTVQLADHPGIMTTTVQNGSTTFTVGTSGVYYIGFKCYSIADQNQLYLDDVQVVALSDCTELPTPGLTTGPDSICPGLEFTLGIENGSTDGGLTYQWETSSDGTTWTAAGASDSTDSYTTALSQDTWFRVQVTCASFGTAISTPLQVTVNPVLECYCNTVDFTSSVEPICNVTFAGINNNSTDTVDGSPALEDFTDLVAEVEQGQSYVISAKGNTNGNYTTYITAFFDWNQDGIFETAVPLGSINNDVCDTVITATVNVPADATIGQSHMRVVKNYNAAPVNPCGSYSFGQAEDYTVLVDIGQGITDVAARTDLSVHPNPASTELFITTPADKPVHVKVYDMVGHLAMEQHMTTKLDITELAPGSYSLLIIGENGMTTGHARFMKL